MPNSIRSAVLGLAISALVPAIAVAEIGEHSLRFATAGADGSPIVLGMQKFAEIVAEKSGGNIEVQLFPGGMLGGDMQVVTSLQGGLVQMSTMNAGLMASFAPDFALLDLPFLFDSPAQADAVMDGPLGDALAAQLDDKGLEGAGLLGARLPQPDEQPAAGGLGRRHRGSQDPRRAVADLSRAVLGARGQSGADALPRSLHRARDRHRRRAGEPRGVDPVGEAERGAAVHDPYPAHLQSAGRAVLQAALGSTERRGADAASRRRPRSGRLSSGSCRATPMPRRWRR